jgi:hypothetical protein
MPWPSITNVTRAFVKPNSPFPTLYAFCASPFSSLRTGYLTGLQGLSGHKEGLKTHCQFVLLYEGLLLRDRVSAQTNNSDLLGLEGLFLCDSLALAPVSITIQHGPTCDSIPKETSFLCATVCAGFWVEEQNQRQAIGPRGDSICFPIFVWKCDGWSLLPYQCLGHDSCTIKCCGNT